MNRHKSGSQKRKEREEKRIESEKNQKKLDTLNFFSKKQKADGAGIEGNKSQIADAPVFEKNLETIAIPNVDDINLTSGSTVSPVSILTQENQHNSEASSKNEAENPVLTTILDVGSKSAVSTSDEAINSESNLASNSQPGPAVTCEEPDANSVSKLKPMNFDIGIFDSTITSRQIEEAVSRGPEKIRENLPSDGDRAFPISIFSYKLPNGETVERDWLVWSRRKNALFCFPCRLFDKSAIIDNRHQSSLAIPDGLTRKWKKLYDRVPNHQNSTSHKQCYIEWKTLENRLLKEASVDVLLLKHIQTEAEKWRHILKIILDVIFFLSERGLALRGESHLIGDPNNGNFLGNLILFMFKISKTNL